MDYAAVAVILLIVTFFIMSAELIIIYMLAVEQDSKRKTENEDTEIVGNLFLSVFDAPTEASRQSEIDALCHYIKDDEHRSDIVCDKLMSMNFDTSLDENQKKYLQQITEAVNPVEIYKIRLQKGDKYQKAYAIRRIADFGGRNEIDNIMKYVKDKDSVLSYNAAMALSILGDGDTVEEFIVTMQDNHDYSHRIIMELLGIYGGDISELAGKMFNSCDDPYVRTAVIKGISKYKLEKFEKLFLDGLSENDINMKCACAKALGEIGSPKYEQALLIAMRDKDWRVRCAAVNSVEKIKTENVLKAVFEATNDKEWWVRNNAAKVLVKIDTNLEYVESVLKSYDKYASDAVKYYLYKNLDLRDAQR